MNQPKGPAMPQSKTTMQLAMERSGVGTPPEKVVELRNVKDIARAVRYAMGELQAHLDLGTADTQSKKLLIEAVADVVTDAVRERVVRNEREFNLCPLRFPPFRIRHAGASGVANQFHDPLPLAPVESGAKAVHIVQRSYLRVPIHDLFLLFLDVVTPRSARSCRVTG